MYIWQHIIFPDMVLLDQNQAHVEPSQEQVDFSICQIPGGCTRMIQPRDNPQIFQHIKTKVKEKLGTDPAVVEKLDSISALKQSIKHKLEIENEEIYLEIFDKDFKQFYELEDIDEVQDKTMINVLVDKDETQTK